MNTRFFASHTASRRALLCIAALGTALACDGDEPTAPPVEAALATVEGTVLNLATREPIVAATVSMGERTATTGPTGEFVLNGIAPGPHRLNGTAAGFAPSSDYILVPSGGMAYTLLLRPAPEGAASVPTGVYDLTASNPQWDSWGAEYVGAEIKATLTIWQTAEASSLAATLYDWHLRRADGVRQWNEPRTRLTGSLSEAGELLLEAGVLYSCRGTMSDSGVIVGSFVAFDGYLDGTFRAVRRPGT